MRVLLQQVAEKAPFTARIGVKRVVDGRLAAQAGSIEEDPDGRLIMQLAEWVKVCNPLLNRSIGHLRDTAGITADLILATVDESPAFAAEQRPLVQAGVPSHLDGDHTKAVHVLIPQIEQALRHVLELAGTPIFKPGGNGAMQIKNLNHILREPAMKTVLGEDLTLYLLTFLADERGHNIRNRICLGLAAPEEFNRTLADHALHALLGVSLVRRKHPERGA